MKLNYAVRQLMLGLTSRSSADYWRRRYRAGLNSGPGSYGELARFKADVLNAFVREHSIGTVIEFGCGDGNQLALADYPRYLGLDVSGEAIDLCAKRFASDPSKSFLWYDPPRTVNLEAFVVGDLALSLDVIYHLLEDDIYDRYLQALFASARRFVIIYSSNSATPQAAWHVKNRVFLDDVEVRIPEFRLIRVVKNPHPEQTFADFYMFERSA